MTTALNRRDEKDRIAAEEEFFAQNPSKLELRPTIKPADAEWKRWRNVFKEELSKETVLDTMEKYFLPVQRSYVMPAPTEGSVTEIQGEDSKAYKELFKPGKRFANVPDNLATKFAMLHFGLPIEHVTVKNIMRCSKEEDASDSDDDDEGPPSIERIMYAEKPLEFLQGYHERSFGYPILRSKVQSQKVHLAC